MTTLDELLARSKDPSKFVERKKFTLSREKAIEKQREFALRHPSQYVLELVQAAVYAGATYMAVDTRPESILVAWVGSPLIPQAQLESLFDYLFADRAYRPTRHLVQLAVAVNAILQRNPVAVRIETGDGYTSYRMDIDKHGNGSVGQVEQPISGTYLFAEFRQGWLQRFTAPSHTPEQHLIEERCLYTPVPILLNGRAPFGYRASRNLEIFGSRHQVQFDDGDRRGVVAHGAALAQRAGANSDFRIVVGGCWVSSLPLDDLSKEPLLGVICDDNLRKTADHSDVVQDGRYVQMLHAVQPHATALLRKLDPGYNPPRLPPIPEEKPVEGPRPSAAQTVKEPLPTPIPMLKPRGTVTLQRLKALGDDPVFFAAPEVAKLLVDAADPVRFPFHLLELTEGQAATLADSLPELGLHRLTGPADIDFVRRVVERGQQSRSLSIHRPWGELVLTFHTEGRLPAWGDGGMPFAVVVGDRCTHVGQIRGSTLGFEGDNEDLQLPHELELHRCSLLLRSDGEARFAPDAADLSALMDEIHKLAAPAQEDADPALLADLLALQAVPHLEIGDRVSVSLPPSWPESLRDLPLADSERGPLSLDDILELYDHSTTARLLSHDDLDRLAPLEARLGHGRLLHPSVDAAPLAGIGYNGHRWVKLMRPEQWSMPQLQAIVFVAGSFEPRLSDDTWQLAERIGPHLVAVTRHEGSHRLLDGWQMLFELLVFIEERHNWSKWTHGHVSAERVADLGRLAMLHLAEHLGQLDQPLLLPSDGGARVSLNQFRTHAQARAAADHGVAIAESDTFLLTLDTLRAASGGMDIKLRYDDAPSVWRSLASDDAHGWLIRQEVQAATLKGWLGLRLPFDPTSGILLRTTGTLEALPELDQRIPCHGLVIPVGHRRLTADEGQLLQLAGLQLYQGLLQLMRQDLSPEEAEAARMYAWVFAARARQRGPLEGTAALLARKVIVQRDGQDWGSLERWLDSPEQERPEAPAGLPSFAVAPPLARSEPESSGLVDNVLGQRLADALLEVGITPYVRFKLLGRSDLAGMMLDDQLALRIVVNADHPLAREGVEHDGPAREVLLLELARRITLWAETQHTVDVDLLHLHRVLLGQRFAQ